VRFAASEVVANGVVLLLIGRDAWDDCPFKRTERGTNFKADIVLVKVSKSISTEDSLSVDIPDSVFGATARLDAAVALSLDTDIRNTKEISMFQLDIRGKDG
jgi:hypothetical protein